MPLLVPAVISTGLFVAIHAMRDLSIPVMLGTGNSTVLAAVVWDLWNNGRASYAAAAGVMLVLLIALIVLSARILGYRLGHQQ